MARQTYNPIQPVSSFGNLSYNTSIVQDFGTPVEDVQRVTADLFQRHETNRVAFAELEMLAESDKENIRKEHPEDMAIVNEVVSEIGNNIANYVAGGNFHNASQVLLTQHKKYATNTKLNSAKQARVKQLALMDELDKLEGYSEEDKIKAKNIANSKAFNQAITTDENGNVIGGYTGWKPSEYVDGKALIKEFASNWKGDDITTESFNLATTGSSPWIQGMIRRDAGLSGEEYVNGATALLMNDEKYMAYLNSKYIIDNFDPNTGDIRNIDMRELTYYNFDRIPAIDAKTKKEIPELDRLEQARDAVSGSIIRMKQDYFDRTGQEISDEQAMKELHRRNYMNDNINSDVMSLYEPYVHTIAERRQKVMADDIYVASFKKSLDNIISATPLSSDVGGLNASDLFNNYNQQIHRRNEAKIKLDNVTKKYAGINTPTAKAAIAAAQADYNSIAAATDFTNNVIKNVVGEIPENELDNIFTKLFNSFNPIKSMAYDNLGDLMNLVGKENLREAIRTGDITKVENLVNVEINKTRSSVTPLSFIPGLGKTIQLGANYVKDYILDNKYIKGLNVLKNEIEDIYKERMAKAGEFYKNYTLIQSTGGMMEETRQAMLNAIKAGATYETLDGRASSSNNYQEEIKGYTDIDINFVTDNVTKEVIGLITHSFGKNSKGEQSKAPVTHLIKPPVLPGALNGVYRDMVTESINNPAYRNYPEQARHNIEIGKAGMVRLRPAFSNNDINTAIGSFGDAINSLGVDQYSAGTSTDKIPIWTATNKGKGIRIAFDKTDEGVKFKYNFSNDSKGWIYPYSSTKPNVHSWLPIIEDYLSYEIDNNPKYK